MSKFRRSLMTLPFENEGEYIQDGLIMHLDCLDTANCSNNYWHSDIGNYTFTGNSQYSERGFYFNGYDTYLKTAQNVEIFNVLPNPFNCTIEVVHEVTAWSKWGMIFADGDWNSSVLELLYSPKNSNNEYTTCCWVYEPNTSADVNHNGGRFIVPYATRGSLGTLSASYSGQNAYSKLGYYNTELMENKYGQGYYSDSSHRGHCMIVGGRVTNGQAITAGSGMFTGYVKAIRYYNRPLTIEEILHNQQIDINRYNITVPTAIKATAATKIQLPYSQKDFRIKIKFKVNEELFISSKNNNTIASVGAGGIGFPHYINPETWSKKILPIYYSISSLVQNYNPSDFETMEIGKIYEFEMKYINNTITGIIDGQVKYQYTDTRYVIRDLYLFSNIADEASLSSIYYCKVYSGETDDSIVYDLVPYDDNGSGVVGFKNLVNNKIITGNNLMAEYE